MYSFCTLFDSGYLDKGIVLYRSLEELPDEIHLYIFAFDDKCYEVLMDMGLEKTTVISLKDFETSEMKKVKQERTKAEYCWTCTPFTIEYVLNNFNVDACTYVDADMMFFSSVKPIFDKMESKKASILITPHRFPPTEAGRKAENTFGRYCVEFNTFKNSEAGRTALSWWRERCLEWCYYEKDGERIGDQKYLDNWTQKFPGVLEVDHWGAGLAPWNIGQCSLLDAKDKDVRFKRKKTTEEWELIFYHYQNIRYLPKYFVNVSADKAEKALKVAIYYPYLKIIEQTRQELNEKYGIEFNEQKSCSQNPFIAFVQKKIIPYKIRSFTDLINLKTLMKDEGMGK